MKAHSPAYLTTVVLTILALCSFSTSAEVTVSLNLTGDANEIIQVLKLLQNEGFLKGSDDAGPGLKMYMNSVTPMDLNDVIKRKRPQKQPKPKQELAILKLAAEPGSAKPGDTVLLTAQISDPDDKVDTVGAVISKVATEGERTSILGADMYDNGTHGDRKPGDGIWSCSVLLPKNVPTGDIWVEIALYDDNGYTLKKKNEKGKDIDLTARTILVLK